ncbi:DUF3618 domain-containing protein [Salinispora arenicola]|uniref:DUF3618 domain-containing protein n=1 Tax=Salinispora arenicola (strain CNS-205) TaxID=391037 RepID=A8LWX7_SALAI|nr:DUF3618 domain-containing protein [Salinispora arenicola]MCN0178795.1 DUF3618 domain-containing protein [Salinispora arenicola]NIL40758.1 DUF3618 domain-containing protein [Salinispora arenicola]NIL57277.1 DUF3618 domain-containing protein [Salinispora arenicola]NIL61333.1 DUF3618 domain-containing protein [Salinispora arenicola]
MTGNGRASGDTEALREEIRRTRVELGETMEALAAKADVRKRLRSSTEQVKERMREQATLTAARVRGRARPPGERVRGAPVPLTALAAGALAAVVVLMIVRGRRR